MVSGGARIKGSTMGDVGHAFVVYCGTWVDSGSWVWSTLKDSLRSFITFSISVCWVGKSQEYVLWTHVRQEYTLFDFELIMYGGKFVKA